MTTPNFARKKRILIVDDDPDSTRMVHLTLEMSGAFELLELNQSLEVFEIVRLFHPDLLLLDIEMPMLGGGEVAHRLRSTREFKTLPIVFMTGLVTEEEAATRIFANGSRVLAKPMTIAKLMECVVEQLDALCRDMHAPANVAVFGSI